MSKECYYCGFKDPLPFTCKFCGNSYCYNHRLPESHNCSGLASYKEQVRDRGKLYEYQPDLIAKKHKTPTFASLTNAISVIKSNYSLTILTLIIVSFFLQYIIPGYFSYLALSPLDVFSRPWTLVTHMFLHDGPFHLLFNMLFLFFFGPELERRIGGRRFLAVFFLSGIVAGIGYSLYSGIIQQSNAPAVGASGALMGIFACLAVLAPHIQVYIYFIPMKITYALIMFALLDLLLFSSGDAIAHSAHLSGVVAGLVIGRQIKKTGRFIGY
jgi:membrane associated rhomboid family serine protease